MPGERLQESPGEDRHDLYALQMHVLADKTGDTSLIIPPRYRIGTRGLFFPESRAAYQKLLAQGWTDAVRELYPREPIYTFWDYFRNAYARNAGIRIDHFLLNARAAKMLIAAGVEREVRGWEKTSDHAPTWITLSDKSKKSGRLKTSRR